MRPIGYYVHHQGVGHWQRAVALARLIRHPVTLMGTIGEAAAATAPCPVLRLPDDVPDGREAGDAAGMPGLHYAPLGHDGLRRRAAAMAGWIAANRPVLMVIDVSVEAAVLSRLLSTPCLLFRLAGRRDDPPHLAAFRGAEALIAPFPAALEAEETEDWLRAKTFHAGFLAAPAPAPLSGGGIVAVFGRGGAGGDVARLAEAARAVPERHWRVIGPVAPGTALLPPNLELLGWREDATAILATADLVIGGGGDGVVAEVAALGKRFLCLPEPRPFDEQGAKARRLEALGAAVACDTWPAAAEWPALIARTAALDPSAITALHDPAALSRTAAFIDGEARRAGRYGCAGASLS